LNRLKCQTRTLWTHFNNTICPKFVAKQKAASTKVKVNKYVYFMILTAIDIINNL